MSTPTYYLPTCPKEEQASLAQLLTFVGPLSTSQPRDTSRQTVEFWKKNCAALEARLTTLKYRPATLYCGNMYCQFDKDYPKFAPIAHGLRQEGLVLIVDYPLDADIVLTTDFDIVEHFKDLQDKMGFFLLGKFTRKNLNREGREIPWNWITLPNRTDLSPGGELEWKIRKVLCEIRPKLV